MLIQEVQDNSGKKNAGVVDADITLTNLVYSITSLSSITWKYASINTIDSEDGRVPGGNIQVAYLWGLVNLACFLLTKPAGLGIAHISKTWVS